MTWNHDSAQKIPMKCRGVIGMFERLLIFHAYLPGLDVCLPAPCMQPDFRLEDAGRGEEHELLEECEG